jgi:hypothetical protein
MTTTQTATLTSPNASNGRNYGDTKETTDSFVVIGIEKGEPVELATARIYKGRSANASRVYASLWLRGGNYASGSGWAAGYGYHRDSAALEEAIRSAGVKLGAKIEGRGDRAMLEALEAIGVMCGGKSVRVFRS